MGGAAGRGGAAGAGRVSEASGHGETRGQAGHGRTAPPRTPGGTRPGGTRWCSPSLMSASASTATTVTGSGYGCASRTSRCRTGGRATLLASRRASTSGPAEARSRSPRAVRPGNTGGAWSVLQPGRFASGRRVEYTRLRPICRVLPGRRSGDRLRDHDTGPPGFPSRWRLASMGASQAGRVAAQDGMASPVRLTAVRASPASQRPDRAPARAITTEVKRGGHAQKRRRH
jgi:hypothetical protein